MKADSHGAAECTRECEGLHAAQFGTSMAIKSVQVVHDGLVL